MTNEITCKKGRCVDPNSIITELSSMYDNSNIIDRINHDLMMSSLGE